MFCLKILVKGRVQGVFFRQGVLEAAIRLSVKGYVRNLPSGDVEALACGDKNAVEALLKYCSVGPSYADVSDITSEIVENSNYDSFRILP